MIPSTTSAAGRYTQLVSLRDPFLQRARECAVLTIPALMPPEGSTGSTKLSTPHQGMGARGVNNLAAKLQLALFPPNRPFFRMLVDDYTLMKMTKREGMRAEVEKALSSFERAVLTKMETSRLRTALFEVIKQLVLAGNVLVHILPQGGIKSFRLDSYVASRDTAGNLLEIVVKESVAPSTLPPAARAVVETTSTDVNKSIDIFTRIWRNGNHWKVHQEISGTIIPGTDGHYPLNRLPWLALRWTRLPGEDYGRGHVEEYLGDLKSYEGLAKAIVEGSAASARLLILVNPNGNTRAKDVAEAPNGAVRTGHKDDVTTLHMDKFADFQVALKTIELIQQRLSYAFMLNAAVQRAGERVTAEEIRYVAGELEDALGGIYSVLSQDFQLPLVEIYIHEMEKARELPPLPKELVRPTITTGLEALGRGHDLNRIQMLLNVLQPLGADAVAQYLNVGDYITRAGNALGIDMAGLVKTQDQIAADNQQAQMMALVQKLGPNAMQILRDQMNPANQQDANGPQAQPSQ